MEPIALHHVWQYTDVDRAFWLAHLESWLPPRIFDAHTHVNEPHFCLEEMTEQKRRQYWVNEVAQPSARLTPSVATRLSFPAGRCPAWRLGFLSWTSTLRGATPASRKSVSSGAGIAWP